MTARKGDLTSVESVTTERKEIKRDPIFTRHDYPFWLEQESFNIIRHIIFHCFAVYMIYLNVMGKAPWSVISIGDMRTLLFDQPELFFGYLGGLGITAGAHRYWTHKTYKANLSLQVILMILQTIAHQQPIYKWSRDHRIHHKYTDTDADPHNSKRGFWFSHMGWLYMPKHKELKQKLNTFDMSDLESDPVVRFQCKCFWTIVLIFFYAIPISATYYIWNMPLFYCLASTYRRYVVSLHFTWCVNSFAHMYGDKPYDKSISSTENPFVSMVAAGEGWHNYHHTFPWDYKTSEFGWHINMSTMFIDFFAAIGWAWDLKSVSPPMLRHRLRRTGTDSQAHTASAVKLGLLDDSFNDLSSTMQSLEQPIWGWDDEALPDDFRQATKILHPAGSN